MKQITVFETTDGQIFRDSLDAEVYESHLKINQYVKEFLLKNLTEDINEDIDIFVTKLTRNIQVHSDKIIELCKNYNSLYEYRNECRTKK